MRLSKDNIVDEVKVVAAFCKILNPSFVVSLNESNWEIHFDNIPKLKAMDLLDDSWIFDRLISFEWRNDCLDIQILDC